MEYRIERDFLGEVKVPAEAYYGIHTQRAYENFKISKYRFQPEFIKALAIVKLAAARANYKLGLLEKNIFEAIEKAALEIIEGKFYDQFIVDIFQTGSGTSTNMNMNEVIASRANELLGGKRGDKKPVHPNDHVNKCQSTNDVIPTTIHVAALMMVYERLLPAMEKLYHALKIKSEEFKDIVKAARTHMQDAVPVTLGQDFSAYASMILHDIEEVKKTSERLKELALGGTAAGTGLNAHPKYAELAIEEISKITGIEFKKANNSFEALQSMNAVLALSSAIKSLAVSLMKIGNDLRLLNSGPNTGLAEIDLPALQPGSSIMPAKVNPIIPEAVTMAAAKLIGNDATITTAAQYSFLELHMMMPLIGYTILESIEIASNTCITFADKCIIKIRANVERCRQYAESSLMVITAITPKIGYEAAAKIAKKAMETRKSIKELLVEEGIVTKEEVDKILDIKKLTEGGIIT
jgi:fumarate hydratase class II